MTQNENQALEYRFWRSENVLGLINHFVPVRDEWTCKVRLICRWRR